MVVIDVLSFTTAVSILTGRGTAGAELDADRHASVMRGAMFVRA
ncbi:MAG TPA: hypothetical protein VND62_03125 [Acidimicrobiales bacterium]|nr:hypothetical protein [Acidimicrobiales bacterium]